MTKTKQNTATNKPNFPQTLEDISNEVDSIEAQIDALKKAKDQLLGSVLERYQDQLKKEYKKKDEPFGTVNIEDEGFQVKFTTPKNVDWDQNGLAELYKDGAPVEVEYSVKEVIFKSLNDAGREAFMPFRTTKPGKVKVELTKKD